MTPSKKTSRRQARELALQALYQLDVQGDSAAPEVKRFLDESDKTPEVVEDAPRLDRDAWTRRAAYDEWIRAASKHRAFSRMAIVDRNILRLAVVEMICRDDPPAKVAIDEAIELGKAFGANESSQFINGILDAIHNQRASSPM